VVVAEELIVARVRRAAPAMTAVRVVQYSDLHGAIKGDVGGYVVLDSSEWHVEHARAAIETATRCGARVILYARLSPTLCAQLLALSHDMVIEVVLQEEGDLALLRAALRRRLASYSAMLLAHISSRLASLPAPLSSATVRLFTSADAPRSVNRLSAVCGLSAHGINARYRRAGFSAAHALMSVARVARACDLLHEGTDVEATAERAGFGSCRSMRRQFRTILAVTPRDAVMSEDVGAMRARLATAASSSASAPKG
jgi:AraC-like DNA-binding protein